MAERVTILAIDPADAVAAYDQFRRVEGEMRGVASTAPAASIADAIRLHRSGRPDEAAAIYRRLLDARPDDPDATHFLGMAMHALGRHAIAAALVRRSIQLAPRVAHFRGNLAAVLAAAGDWDGAVGALDEAVQLAPASADAQAKLGAGLERVRRHADSLRAYDEAVRLGPTYAEAHNGRGRALRSLGQVEAAAAAHRQAVRLDPDLAPAWSNLAAVQAEQGDPAAVVASYRQLVALRPSSAADHSALLYAMHYDSALAPADLFAEHRRWADRHAARLRPAVLPHANAPDPDRRLRVGYVSPDLRENTVTRFLLPVLEHHDRSQFQVFCYSDVASDDAVTERVRTLSDGWRDIRGLSDARAAEIVRDDLVDVLVDLRGHGAGNRLPMFARKPAPVQVTYIGYFDTTGLATMDYRVTDDIQDPPGLTERFHAERLLRLPRCSWCYSPDPPDEHPPAPGPPSASTGVVTFGSLNKVVKASPVAIELWSKVLLAVPGSRLLAAVLGGEGNVSARHHLEGNGIPGDRLILAEKSPTPAGYLRRFDDIDVSLDPTPFCGITTTCDSLWMGVPVVTLAGQTSLARCGASILTGAGFPQWVAKTPEEYVSLAVALATDERCRRELRTALRTRMLRSDLCDGRSLAGCLEARLRESWRAWCHAGDEARRRG